VESQKAGNKKIIDDSGPGGLAGFQYAKTALRKERKRGGKKREVQRIRD